MGSMRSGFNNRITVNFENVGKTLEQKGIEFEERNIGSGWTRDQLMEAVPTARSLPQIFLDGEYIGTYTHLKTHFNL